jgi:hypothetical protein
MAIDHLTLPNFTEPPPRITVVARYAGPVFTALRRHSGYRFVAGDGRPSSGIAWIERQRPGVLATAACAIEIR